MVKHKKSTKVNMKKKSLLVINVNFIKRLFWLNGFSRASFNYCSKWSEWKYSQRRLHLNSQLRNKKTTGKFPIEHAVTYEEGKNHDKKKEPCLSFIEKTNSKICSIVKKQLNLTKSKIIKRSQEKPIKDHTSSLQPKIDKKSKIKYLD